MKDTYHDNLSGQIRSFQNRVRTLAVANLMFKLNQKLTRLPAISSAGNTFVHSILHGFSVSDHFYDLLRLLIPSCFNKCSLQFESAVPPKHNVWGLFFETLYSLMYPYLPHLLLERDSLLRQVLEFFLDRSSLLPRNIRLLICLE